MKIAFLGTQLRMDKVKEILKTIFPELDTIVINDESHIYEHKIEKKLLLIREKLDGIIFGGTLHYELYHELFLGYCPCTCLPADANAFHNALLQLAVKGIDLQRISIDNVSYPTVKRIMDSLDLDMTNISFLEKSYIQQKSSSYYDTISNDHIDLYRNGSTTGAVTTLYHVYKLLKELDIPVAYVIPTYDVIVRTIKDLLAEINHRLSQPQGALAVIIIRLIPKEEVFLHTTGDYLESHEKLKAADEIHYFARNNRATVITQADDQYTIIIKYTQLMNYTLNLQIFPLLQKIWDHTRCNFSVGIGCGYDPWDSRLNAAIALKKASHLENAGVFVSYSPLSVVGPLEYVDYNHSKAKIARDRILNISHETRISEDILSKISEYMEQSQKTILTSRDLCGTLDISPRMSNRILSALEINGYAEIVNHVNLGKAGRPSNVYQIKI